MFTRFLFSPIFRSLQLEYIPLSLKKHVSLVRFSIILILLYATGGEIPFPQTMRKTHSPVSRELVDISCRHGGIQRESIVPRERWSEYSNSRNRREYRFNAVDRFPFHDPFFAWTLNGHHDRWETEKMRSMRQEGREVDTVERGCRVGAFRECRRLRLMLFTQSPGYHAFLWHDWLLPRAPVRSLVLSNRIVGARGTTTVVAFSNLSRDSFIFAPPSCDVAAHTRADRRRHSSDHGEKWNGHVSTGFLSFLSTCHSLFIIRNFRWCRSWSMHVPCGAEVVFSRISCWIGG